MGISNITCEFIGSFYKLSQLPVDRRPQIAFAGRSNVGKSSLLNRLVGRKKKVAKVSSTPGKTQSLNFYLINDKYYYVDLPGYGYAKVPQKVKENWGRLLHEYLEKSEDLIGLMLLLDCRRNPSAEDIQMLKWLSERRLPVIVPVTKSDKIKRNALAIKVREIEKELEVPAIPFSSVSGLGKKELIGAINHLVDEHYQRIRA